MKTPILALAIGTLTFSTNILAAGNAPLKQDQAADLFQKAVQADTQGDTVQRQELLAEVLKLDPHHKLARWYSGQIYFQGRWRSHEYVENLTSQDPRWQDYHSQLEQAENTLEDHLQLARWCEKHGLNNETKLHWYQVLKHNPDNQEALGSLGLRRFAGGLHTTEEIELLNREEDQAKKDFQQYERKLKRLSRLARTKDIDAKNTYLSDISAIEDPAAVDALFDLLVTVSNKSRGKDQQKSDSHDIQVGNAVVSALSNIEEHEATLRLLDIAVFAPQNELRRSAALALRYREPTTYVPLLMARLSAPLEYTFNYQVTPTGQVNLQQEIYEDGPESAVRRSHSSSFNTFEYVRFRNVERNSTTIGRTVHTHTRETEGAVVIPNTEQDLVNASMEVANSKSLVEQENNYRKEDNKRITDVLELALNKEFGDDLQEWWSEWKEYNELYTPDEIPVEETYTYEASSSPPPKSYINQTNEYNSYTLQPARPWTPRAIECFIAGTLVWTQNGTKAIEDVKAGDLVMSQDPFSGEIDYRPVLDTTIRPPTPVVTLSLPLESITATHGHRFWNSGNGWKMAKALDASDLLFSPTGSVQLTAVEDAGESEVYNLVVGDFHTYFVGKSRLLVHDNNCPLPTIAKLPGVTKAMLSK